MHGIYVDYPILNTCIVSVINASDLFDKFNDDDIENEAMNYYYNEETEESYSFWREAVKKVPEFVKQDIAELRASLKEVWNNDLDIQDFSFSKQFAEI